MDEIDGWQTAASVISQTTPSTSVSRPSGSSWNDEIGCLSCGNPNGLDGDRHACCHCADGGRVRRGLVNGQSLSIPCPQCSGSSANPGIVEDPTARMKIPKSFREASFDQWQPPNGLPRVRCVSYATSWPPAQPILALMGNKGTGKTTLSCAVQRAVYQRHQVRSQFWPVIDLLDRYRRTFDRDRATETLDDVDNELRAVPLLVIDDYGAHSGTEFSEERLFALIDYRYRERLPLIITSNISLLDMPHRVKSRLSDAALCQIVPFTGQDMRPQPRSTT